MSEEKRKSSKLPKESGSGVIVQQPVAQLRDRPQGYMSLFDALKKRIAEARIKAALSVNQELILLYWDIGSSILASQREYGWGTKVIDSISNDLRQEFPQMKGFSIRSLKYMRAFAGAYPDRQFVQQAAAQIPWGHNVRLIERVKDPDERLWYIQQGSIHASCW